jgi:A/G-specific adenine glycosylase
MLLDSLTPKKIQLFQKEILDWYSKNKRDLPWRRTRDPYKILVSEVMLQQTQVGRVVPKYDAWLMAFPTVERLAKASRSDILKLWSGLGYNRRALYLQKTAQAIVSQHAGKWPKDILELQKLPGIGRYTAGAVACFAFDQQVAVVDTNIRKVILAKFQIPSTKSQKEIQEIADVILPIGKAYEWNQALMDYASAILKKEKIAIPKQSKFHGSNRYYRGKVLRLLLNNEKLAIFDLGIQLKADYSSKDSEWLSKILLGMEKDDLLIIKDGSVSLANS